MVPAAPIGVQIVATWRWIMTITTMASAVAHGVVSGCILPPPLATSSPTEKGQRNAGPFLE